MDFPGRIVERDDEIKRRAPLEPRVARAVLMQHHAERGPALALPAVRTTLARRSWRQCRPPAPPEGLPSGPSKPLQEGGTYRTDRVLPTATLYCTVDSELACPVLAAYQMSAASAFVPLWDCGQRGSAAHSPTGSPPSGFKRRIWRHRWAV